MKRRLISQLPLLGPLLLFVCLSASAQVAPSEEQALQPAPEIYIPTDLEDCFAELMRILKPEDVQAMRDRTEADMIQYHRGLGMWMRNNWGLWQGSRLSEWFNANGIGHPEDMSGIILNSFWRHLHGQDIDLDGQVTTYQAYWAQQRQQAKQEQQRADGVVRRIGAMVMGMSLERSKAATVRLPRRKDDGLRARYLARYRNGVLLAIRQGDVEAFTTPGYFLDLQHRSLHPIRVPEIAQVHSVVVADGIAYFSGVSGGTPLLMAISERKRTRLALPVGSSPLVLGLDGANLLAVYGHAIYRREGTRWVPVYRGSIELPRSGLPPRKFGHRVFFRDEGHGENEKRLWWLDLESKPRLIALDEDVGVVGSYGPRWENSFSYCVTHDGVLWATLGEGHAQKSLIRRSTNGKYALAVVNNNLRFDGELFGNESSNDGLDVSAVALDADRRVIAGGRLGLYAIDGKLIRELVSFDNTTQAIPMSDSLYHWRWDLSEILDLAAGRYVLAGAFGGIYLLERDAAGQYALIALDEGIGAPITF